MPSKRSATSAVATETGNGKRFRRTAAVADSSTFDAESTDSDASATDTSEHSQLGSESSDTSPKAIATVAKDWTDATVFDGDVCQPSRFPIFRDSHVLTRQPVADKTEEELARLTFDQWLEYFLSHPSFAGPRRYLMSDERYVTILNLCVSGQRLVEYIEHRKMDKESSAWLYPTMVQDTYKYLVLEFRGRLVSEIDTGPVLLCFQEPTGPKGERFTRRHVKSTYTLTLGNMVQVVAPKQTS